MRTLIVDDERLARNRLRRMLARSEGIEVIGEATDGKEALVKIAELQPDIVFLDIRMPELDGIEVARRLPKDVHVVFTTAYDEYAVQAFETSAVDYLLKPIESDRLDATVARLQRLDAEPAHQELEQLLRKLASREGPPRISARRGETIHIFDPLLISRFHAEDRYIMLRHRGQEYLLDNSIVALEKLLAPWGFLKIHRSELINLEHVEGLTLEDDVTFVILADGQRAAVSRRHLGALKQRLGIAGK